jgi:hypothetical protein
MTYTVSSPDPSGMVCVVVSTMADPDGHFRATVPLRAETNVITATATPGTDATGWTQATVKS